MANRDDDSKGRKDPLVWAFLAMVAVAFVLGIVLGLRALSTQRTPDPSRASQSPTKSTADFLGNVRRRIRSEIDRLAGLIEESPPQSAAPEPPKQKRAEKSASFKEKPPAAPANESMRVYPATTPPDGPPVTAVSPDSKWTYDVFFGPDWPRSGQLRYSTKRQPGQAGLGATMSWVPDSGQVSTWFLGVLEANHPSHANTRFPGFFMHPVYLPRTMENGSRITWEIPWQGGGRMQVRRFDMRVAGWNTVTVQAGEFKALHLQGTLRYLDNEAVKAEVRYELWYSPQVRQVVRVLWLGRSPDESSAAMIAELASYDIP